MLSHVKYYRITQGIDPRENEYLPIPVQYRPHDNKFDFHEEKLAKRNAAIEARGHYRNGSNFLFTT